MAVTSGWHGAAVKTGQIVPPSDLLEQLAGVEDALRRGRRLGAVGWAAFAVGLVQAALVFANAAGRISLPTSGLGWLLASAVVSFALFVLLTQWLRWWVAASKRPFRYVYSISEFEVIGERYDLDLTWLAHDVSSRLSERITRLSRVDESPRMVGDEPQDGARERPVYDSHVHISGTWGVRLRHDGIWQIVVTPWVRVGPPSAASSMAHRVTFRAPTIDSPLPAPVRLSIDDYDKLVERVYFSVATEIYKQIRENVRQRIRLMPWRSFRAAAYFYEAEDYLRSNTLDAYEDASELYLEVIRAYDPSWIVPPEFWWRRVLMHSRSFLASLRWRMLALGTHFWQRLGHSELMVARSYIGYAKTLVYRRLLAGLSGQRQKPVFEARPAMVRAMTHLQRVPDHVEGRQDTYFDAYVTRALIMFELHAPGEACCWLEKARGREPIRKEHDPAYLFVRGYVEPKPHSRLQFLRRAVEANPKYETAQFELAKATELLWRSRPTIEPEVARTGPLPEYQKVVDLNPANVMAWANIGYIYWLLGELDTARQYYERGREYKDIKRSTFVGRLDGGLARIAAEQGRFDDAYRHYIDAVAATTAESTPHETYLGGHELALVSDAMLARFAGYRETVRGHLDKRDLPVTGRRPRNSVWAFVLNDCGEASYAYFVRTQDTRHLEQARRAFKEASSEELGGRYVIPHYNLHHLRALRELDYTGDHILRVVELAPTWTDGNLELMLFRAGRRQHLSDIAGEAERSARDRQEQAKAHRDRFGTVSPTLATGTRGRYPTQVTGRRTDVAEADERPAQLLELQAHTDLERAGKFQVAMERIDRVADGLIYGLLPHDWLWAGGAAGMRKELRRDIFTRRAYRRDLRWERQLDDSHVRALRAWFATAPRKARHQALTHLRRHFWPEDFDLLRDSLQSEDPEHMRPNDETRSALARLLDRAVMEAPEYWKLRYYMPTEGVVSRERTIDKFCEVIAYKRLVPGLAIWVGDQLTDVLQSSKHAITAWTRALQDLEHHPRSDQLASIASRLRKHGEWEKCIRACEPLLTAGGPEPVRTRPRAALIEPATADEVRTCRLEAANARWRLGQSGAALGLLEAVTRDSSGLRWRRRFVEDLIAFQASPGQVPRDFVWELQHWLGAEVRRNRGADDEACADAVVASLVLRRAMDVEPQAQLDERDGRTGAAAVSRLVIAAHPDFFPEAGRSPMPMRLFGPSGLRQLRRQIREQFGVVLPWVRLTTSAQLPPGHFTILLDDSPGPWIAVDPNGEFAVEMVAALRALALRNLDRLVGIQEAADLLRDLERAQPEMSQTVDRLIRSPEGMGRLIDVLQRLLRERIPLTDLTDVLRGVQSGAAVAGTDELVEHVRGILRPELLGVGAGTRLVRLSREDEASLARRVDALEWSRTAIHDRLSRLTDDDGDIALVVVEPALRLPVRMLVETAFPELPVVTLDDVRRSSSPRPLTFLDAEAVAEAGAPRRVRA